MHLVTGGSGYVGSAIVRGLLARQQRVRVLDLWRSPDLPEEVEYVEADINDAPAVRRAMQGVEYVHHNVALVPIAKAGERFWKVNVDGTRVALEAARAEGVRMFANMSSSAVFGRPRALPVTLDTPREPIEIYGRAKKAAEDLVLEAGEAGLPVASIRPRTVIGTGRLGIFQILFDWIKDGANVFVLGSGANELQFVQMDDLAAVSVLACLKEQPGVYNVGTDRYGTLRGDLEALCAHAGTGSKVKSLPAGPTVGTLRLLDKMGLSPLGPYHYMTYHKPLYFDSAHVTDRLGWTPRFSNQDMLKDSYDWYVENYDAKAASGTSAHKSPVKQGALRLMKRLT